MLLYTNSFFLVLLLCSVHQTISKPNNSPPDISTSVEARYVRNPQQSDGVWSWLGGWYSSAHDYLLGNNGFITSLLPSFLSGKKNKPEEHICYCPLEGKPTVATSDGTMEIRSAEGKLLSAGACFGFFWYNLGNGIYKFVKITPPAIYDLVRMKVCERMCGCAPPKPKKDRKSAKNDAQLTKTSQTKQTS